MKTDLTLTIERALKFYDPSEICGIKVNMFRPRIQRFEVPVTCGTVKDGLVDCLSSREVIMNIKTSWACCRDEPIYSAFYGKNPPIDCEEKSKICKTEKVRCPYQGSMTDGDAAVLLTAYEIKVTKQDFHSNHGHNFCGHMNFYVMPLELYKEVKGEILAGIGVIAMLKNGSLRKVKDSAYRPLSQEDQKWMLLSLLKKEESK